MPDSELLTNKHMAYTIEGLAKANGCDEHTAIELASVWAYWLECNCNDTQCIKDFMRLRRKDRAKMLNVMKLYHHDFGNVRERIVDHIISLVC